MPIHLSPRPVAAIRARFRYVDSCLVLIWAVAIVVGIAAVALGVLTLTEMQELTISIADECKRIGPNDLPQCVAILDK